jgi:hypothetical protein
VHYHGTGGSVEIPFRYPGDSAMPAITQAYHLAAIIEQETGLAGLDLPADQPTAGGDLELAATTLGESSVFAREFLAGRGLTPEDVW